MICLVVKFVFKDGKINEFMDILRSPDGLAVTRAAKDASLQRLQFQKMAVQFIYMNVGIVRKTIKPISNLEQITGCWMH